MQGSDVGRLRDPRVPRIPRIPPVAALTLWVLGALVFAFLPQGSEAKPVISTQGRGTTVQVRFRKRQNIPAPSWRDDL